MARRTKNLRAKVVKTAASTRPSRKNITAPERYGFPAATKAYLPTKPQPLHEKEIVGVYPYRSCKFGDGSSSRGTKIVFADGTRVGLREKEIRGDLKKALAAYELDLLARRTA